MRKLVEILLKPFQEHFLFLVCFFVLATSPLILLQIFVRKLFLNSIFVTLHCFVLSYVITLLIGFIKTRKLREIIQGIILSIFAIDFVINIFCILQFGYLFDGDVLLLILGTDSNEAKEFVSVMIPKWIIVTIGGILISFLVLWRLGTRKNLNLGKKTSYAALGILCLSFAASAYTWQAWSDGPVKRWYDFTEYEGTEDLTSYYSHPSVLFAEGNQLPSNVVLIIGESFARNHSSLYGYDKKTNPYLSACMDSLSLFTFDSIDSPAATTAKSIRMMLSLYSANEEENEGKNWFECISIIELMHVCGYDCHWISNQAKGSKNNGAARVFAEACDHQTFLQQEGSDDHNVNVDEVLVDSSRQLISQLDLQQHSFIIYHMMGSHFSYKMRYPSDFAKFSENDYHSEPESHRNILATYDNSILYNDYVVKQIINLFKDKESLIIYLPDHGQVMYRDPDFPNHFSHGNESQPLGYAYGIEIPFIIYASPLYQQNHPSIIQRIKARANNPKHWNSDDLPYLIMDLIGVTSINGESITSKSVLN